MPVISKATETNWARLNTNSRGRLTKRANKRKSKKVFIPKEYLMFKQSKKAIEALIEKVRENKYPIGSVIYTLCLVQLKQNSLCDDQLNPLDYIAQDFSHPEAIIHELAEFEIPEEEFDFVGAVYQSLKKEGVKNSQGSYFTPKHIALAMSSGFEVSQDQKLLDPCCGTGAILLAVKCSDPRFLYGCDTDKLAVLICKTNLYCRFSNMRFSPNIVCGNYLTENVFDGVSFSGIITNPPWGAVADYVRELETVITSKESASIFLERAINTVSCNGFISFLLPKAILNIAAHSDIRQKILENTSIDSITLYSNIFTGVTTQCFNIVLRKKDIKNRFITVNKGETQLKVDVRNFARNDDYSFRLIDSRDSILLNRVFKRCSKNLSDSSWALGIVTGNNKEKVSSSPDLGMESIFTGKEIKPFELSAPKSYIKYDPANFQQAAKEEFYRSDEKLVYKFISKKLVFALDTTGALCLNSANILIPNISGLTTKTVAALLNSELYQYMYISMFDDPKILKGNLCKLPFPDMTAYEVGEIDSLVDMYLAGLINLDDINDAINRVFNLSNDEITRIKEICYGAA